MKRIVRWLMGVSGVLWLFAALLWVRSYRVSDVIVHNRAESSEVFWTVKHYGVWAGRGRVVWYRVGWSAYRTENAPALAGWSVRHVEAGEPAAKVPGYGNGTGRFGFHVVRDPWGAGSLCVVVPIWVIAVGSGVLPGWGLMELWRWRVRRRRARRGECVWCGYDLRASSGRCPECGREMGGESKSETRNSKLESNPNDEARR